MHGNRAPKGFSQAIRQPLMERFEQPAVDVHGRHERGVSAELGTPPRFLEEQLEAGKRQEALKRAEQEAVKKAKQVLQGRDK